MKKILLLTIVLSQLGLAATSQTSTKQNRENDPFGAYLSIGTPFPTLGGMNIAYNLNQDLRVFLGYGENEVTSSISFSEDSITTGMSKATVLGVGAQYFMSDWMFRPALGLTVSSVKFSGEGKLSINGISEDGTILSSQLGLDWQSGSGYQLGFGLQSALNASASSMYVNTGYFF